MSQLFLSDLKSSIEIISAGLNRPTLHSHQVKTLEYLATGQNVINQLPCGSGTVVYILHESRGGGGGEMKFLFFV